MTNSKTTIDATNATFSICTDLVAIGTDPEMADFDNQRGELFGEAHSIVATFEDGRRFAHEAVAVTYNGQDVRPWWNEDAKRAFSCANFTVFGDVDLEALQALLKTVERRRVLNPDRWAESRAMYGSEAYLRDGWNEYDVEMEREEDARGW